MDKNKRPLKSKTTSTTVNKLNANAFTSLVSRTLQSISISWWPLFGISCKLINFLLHSIDGKMNHATQLAVSFEPITECFFFSYSMQKREKKTSKNWFTSAVTKWHFLFAIDKCLSTILIWIFYRPFSRFKRSNEHKPGTVTSNQQLNVKQKKKLW